MLTRCARVTTLLLLAMSGFATEPSAQEVCGLQSAVFDAIFVDDFDSASAGGGLGPPLGTVTAPTLGVTPSVTITYPSPGASLPLGRVQVSGTLSGPLNTGVSVNGERAYAYNGVFLTPEINFGDSVTSLTAEATSMDGFSATAALTVSSSDSPAQARLVTDSEAGFAPLPVQFRITIAKELNVQAVAVDFDGDGISDYNGVSTGYLPSFTYASPGIHTATATLTLVNSQQIVVTHKVIALDFDQQRSQVCSVYAYFRTRLLAQDANGASNALTDTLGARIQPLFVALGTRMPTVAAKLGTLADGLIGLDRANVIAVQEVENENELRGYPIRFARDAKGVWRIESM